MIDRVSGQMLFDEYAIPVESSTISWRRPDEVDIQGAMRGEGPLYSYCRQFANDLKALYIFAPTVYVDPMWLFNNPLLMVLSNLSERDPNCAVPIFQCRPGFFTLYWAERKTARDLGFRGLVNHYYPGGKKSHRERNSSWLDDIYNSRKARHVFDAIVRNPLNRYVESCLATIEQYDDPGVCGLDQALRDCVLAMYEAPLQGVPYDLLDRERASRTLRYALDHYRRTGERFTMTGARATWRGYAAKEGYDDCLQQGQVLDWILREGVYLRAHAVMARGIAAAFSSRSVPLDALPSIPHASIVSEKKKAYLRIVDRDWPIVDPTGVEGFSSQLSCVTFEDIADGIRRQPFYDEYKRRLGRISTSRSERTAHEYFEAISWLLSHVVPILHEKSAGKAFSDKFDPGIRGFIMMHGGKFLAVIGAMLGAAAATLATQNLALPIALLNPIVEGGAAILPAIPPMVLKRGHIADALRPWVGRKYYKTLARMQVEDRQ